MSNIPESSDPLDYLATSDERLEPICGWAYVIGGSVVCNLDQGIDKLFPRIQLNLILRESAHSAKMIKLLQPSSTELSSIGLLQICAMTSNTAGIRGVEMGIHSS